MKNQDELREELKELLPFLSRIQGKDEGFSVPKNYFKTLPDEVMKRIASDIAPTRQQKNWMDEITLFIAALRQPRYAVALATAAVLLVAGFWMFNRDSGTRAASPDLAAVALEDISYDALYSYIATNIEDIDNDLILDAQKFETAEKPLQHLAPRPGEEEMEEYLDDVIDEIDLKDLEDLL
ncbi:MAG: hypothetical protein EPO28_04255 [Saprospiraceae bacterium]|nr:MAG: hypothetical protein EPO28_04255 [Saprospiraceae bacterium]